jgi:hypothetical protein
MVRSFPLLGSDQNGEYVIRQNFLDLHVRQGFRFSLKGFSVVRRALSCGGLVLRFSKRGRFTFEPEIPLVCSEVLMIRITLLLAPYFFVPNETCLLFA